RSRLQRSQQASRMRGAALARALVAARTNAGPGSEMGIAGKAAHIGADLGEDLHRSEVLHPRHGTHLLDGGAKGRKAGLHLLVDLVDCGIEGPDLIEVKAQWEAVLPGDAPPQGLAQGLS